MTQAPPAPSAAENRPERVGGTVRRFPVYTRAHTHTQTHRHTHTHTHTHAHTHTRTRTQRLTTCFISQHFVARGQDGTSDVKRSESHTESFYFWPV